MISAIFALSFFVTWVYIWMVVLASAWLRLSMMIRLRRYQLDGEKLFNTIFWHIRVVLERIVLSIVIKIVTFFAKSLDSIFGDNRV